MAKSITHILKDVILPLNASSDKIGGKTNGKLLFSQPLTNGQAETALNHISGQFVAGKTSAGKPAKAENSTGDNIEKTVTDFLREIQSSQPFDEAALSKKSVSVELKLSKPPEKLSVADYDAATWKAIFNKAGYSLLTDEELGMAVQAMKNTGYKPSEKGFTLSNLRKFDALPGPMFVKTDQATIERAKRAGQAVLQYQAYKADRIDKAIQAGKDYVNDAIGGFVQPVVNVVPNLYNGISEPFRAGEKLAFGTNYIPGMPRMEVAERSEYWNKDGRMLANKGAEFTATIYFGGAVGSRMLLTQTGRILTGAEAGYNIGAGLAGKDATQTDGQGNYRQMSTLERGLRITGGVFSAKQTINAELAAPNSAVNKLDDIFKNPPSIKPQTELVTPDGLKVRVNANTFDEPFQTADDLNSKIVTVDSNGNPSGTRFRNDYETHIKQRDYSNPSQKSGVNGAHNINEFEQFDIAVNPTPTKSSIKIVSKTPHPTVKGIFNIEYEMPKLNSKLQVIGWRLDKGKPFVKTVYDSKIISDSQMMQWGREAFAEAIQRNPAISGTSSNLKWEGSASNGLKFEGWIDTKGSESVRTFYPKF